MSWNIVLRECKDFYYVIIMYNLILKIVEVKEIIVFVDGFILIGML